MEKIIDKNSGETEIVDGICVGDECNRPEHNSRRIDQIASSF